MKFVFVGGTRWLGPVTVRLALAAGHEVAVAHSGKHEGPGDLDVEHLHGERGELLAPGGAVERAHPDIVVDTFGGATAKKAEATAACAARAGAKRIIAVSSVDVYQASVDAGLGDGSGFDPFSRVTIPIDEGSPLRPAPYPGSAPSHDNVAMEAALWDSEVPVTAIRPGAIYGIDDPQAREWPLVKRALARKRKLYLPGGGGTVFHRVAIDRVAMAIVAAADRAPDSFWACNVVDPYDWTYAGLAAEIADLLEWEWEPEDVPFDEQYAHPFMLRRSLVVSDRRLRDVLGVTEPDPREALQELVHHLAEHGPREGALYS
jgi:nucleoside-diphosphate-sugar epimerase